MGRGLLPRGGAPACGPPERPPCPHVPRPVAARLRRRDLPRVRVVRQRRRVARRPPPGRTRRRRHGPGRGRHRPARERRDPGRRPVRQPRARQRHRRRRRDGRPARGRHRRLRRHRRHADLAQAPAAGGGRLHVPSYGAADGAVRGRAGRRAPPTAAPWHWPPGSPGATWRAWTPPGWAATSGGSWPSSPSRSGSASSPSPSSRGWAGCSSRSTSCTSVREMRDDRRAGVRRGPGAAEAAAVPRAPLDPRRHRADADHAGRHLRRLAAVRAAAGVGRPGARPAVGGGRAPALADRHRAARDHERHHLGPSGQAAAGPGQHLRRDDDPGDGPLRHRHPAHLLAVRHPAGRWPVPRRWPRCSTCSGSCARAG